jgi:N-acetylglucosamine-6-phosphate deacetylase
MIRLSGADIVLPDRLLSPGTVVIEGDRIVDVVAGSGSDLHGHYVVPGFIDVHMHGVNGYDTLDSSEAVGAIASFLPRHGTTAFCPTSIACTPEVLRRLLSSIAALRSPGGPDRERPPRARVLPAHLESNFINPEFKGAQPLECLRRPNARQHDGEFSGAQILEEIANARAHVGIVTVAPEVDGVLDLIRLLVRDGHHVSLGHSGATYEEALAGIDAGARQATHLFNRMTPIAQRAPGLAAAVLESDDVAAELVSDGCHVHPAMMRVAIAAKGPSRVMAITDGTAGAGLPRGATSVIGGRRITVGDVALLEDGTIAGSVLTMDQAFGRLVSAVGVSLVDAATMCSTTPARELGLHGLGVIAPGATADLVVLDRDLKVVRTYIAGELAWPTVRNREV